MYIAWRFSDSFLSLFVAYDVVKGWFRKTARGSVHWSVASSCVTRPQSKIITRSIRFSNQQEMKRACTFSNVFHNWWSMNENVSRLWSLAVYNRLLDFATKISWNSPTKHRLVSGRQATCFESLGTNDPKVSCVNLRCENNSTRWNCAEQTAFITKVCFSLDLANFKDC